MTAWSSTSDRDAVARRFATLKSRIFAARKRRVSRSAMMRSARRFEHRKRRRARHRKRASGRTQKRQFRERKTAFQRADSCIENRRFRDAVSVRLTLENAAGNALPNTLDDVTREPFFDVAQRAFVHAFAIARATFSAPDSDANSMRIPMREKARSSVKKRTSFDPVFALRKQALMRPEGAAFLGFSRGVSHIENGPRSRIRIHMIFSIIYIMRQIIYPIFGDRDGIRGCKNDVPS